MLHACEYFVDEIECVYSELNKVAAQEWTLLKVSVLTSDRHLIIYYNCHLRTYLSNSIINRTNRSDQPAVRKIE